MDRAVHTEHSSAPRRARREAWRLRRSTPSASVPEDGDDSVFVPADADDFAD